MKTVVVCFVLIGLLVANDIAKPIDGELQFKSTDDSFAVRISAGGFWEWLLWSGVWWNSLEFQAHNDSLAGDYIWGSIYVGTGWYPVNWLSYFAANLNVHRNITANKTDYDWGNFTVDQSSSFIASSWLILTEKDPDGNQVRYMNMSSFFWDYDEVKSTQMSNKAEGIIVSDFFGRHLIPPDPCTVELIYIMTQKAGTLDTSTEPLIVPKAIESFIKINNWKYASPDNTLSLTMVVGTGASSWHSSGHVTSGSGAGATFFRVADTVLVGTSVEKVKISAELATEGSIAFRNPSVEAQLHQRYDASVEVTIITVEFPANANPIEYDPTSGVGQDPYLNNPDLGLIIGVVIAGVVFILLVIGALYYAFGRRAQYDNVK